MKIKSLKISFFQAFLALSILNITLFTIAFFTYSGNFLFWQYPLSYLGTVDSKSHLPNMVSQAIYSVDMLLSGFILFYVGIRYQQEGKPDSFLKALVCILGGIGFGIATFAPDDTAHRFHVLGSALLVAALWILATTFIYEVAHKVSFLVSFFWQGFLQIPIFLYAGAFFLNLDPYAAALQKFVLFYILITTLIATKLIEGEPVNKRQDSVK